MAAPLCDCDPPVECVRRQSNKPSSAGRSYWTCASGGCSKFIWDDQKGTVLSRAGPNCTCNRPSILKVSHTAANPGREFWSCAASGKGARCHFFQWVDPGTTPAKAPGGERTPTGTPAGTPAKAPRGDGTPGGTPAGSPLPGGTPGAVCEKCNAAVRHQKVSESNTKGNAGEAAAALLPTLVSPLDPAGVDAGRLFYKCVSCSLFKWLTAEPKAPAPTPETPGSVEHVVPEVTRRLLSQLFEVPADAGLGHGRDNADVTAVYDHLAIECAWRVHNPQRSARYAAFRDAAMSTPAPKKLELRPAHTEAVAALLAHEKGLQPLNGAVNEVLLLHGTKPENVFPILFQGMDPELAKLGLFGSGSYFAEHAAKIDQYTRADEKWCARDDGHALQPLHQKLYEHGVKHPGTAAGGGVYYALVCRVTMGAFDTTKDGSTTLKDARLFADGNSGFGGRKLAGGAHALCAEVGGKVARYREFVCFEPAAIDVEYLVAYKREKHYCDCGLPAVRRTVTKEGPNQGRNILFCSKPRDDASNCNFIHMLPVCKCGMSAAVKLKKNGEPYYSCGAKRDHCDYRDWDGPPRHGSPSPSPAKRARLA
jgi:hypothetical protein